jgi:ubiquinone/menaquinone biosynthesis C-methylase UbiE
MPKDLFSKQADLYARYRPTYPPELYDYILGFVNKRANAWDCATGNGQAAQVLAGYFNTVEATDISEAQLQKAVKKPNIRYRICPAEQTPFEESSFDLITIATAYHWLNWKEFYREATRVGKPGAVVAAWAYHLVRCRDENINTIIDHFYKNIVAPYWDKGRKYVDEAYATVAFDFEPLPSAPFEINVSWSKEAFKGYLLTWSAVQAYIKQNNSSPVDLIAADLDLAWQEEKKPFHFPIFLRIGRIKK